LRTPEPELGLGGRQEHVALPPVEADLDGERRALLIEAERLLQAPFGVREIALRADRFRLPAPVTVLVEELEALFQEASGRIWLTRGDRGDREPVQDDRGALLVSGCAKERKALLVEPFRSFVVAGDERTAAQTPQRP